MKRVFWNSLYYYTGKCYIKSWEEEQERSRNPSSVDGFCMYTKIVRERRYRMFPICRTVHGPVVGVIEWCHHTVEDSNRYETGRFTLVTNLPSQ